jgi:hypothetical protein
MLSTLRGSEKCQVFFYYKGSCLSQVFSKGRKEFDEFKNKFLYTEAELNDDSFLLGQLDDIEKYMREYEKENPHRIFQLTDGSKMLKYVAEKLRSELFRDHLSVRSIWTLNIIYLVHRGTLKDDMMNGFLIIDGNGIQNFEDGYKKQTLCGLCNKKASQKCSRCLTTYYCCVEHQKEHWKEHKKACELPDDKFSRKLRVEELFKN